ncbi:hypothetical protein M422DRAFT_252562 [Sphaerobolus stellatus SS14]|uniref:Uncharacterized protein n=1 Tax=Sphaerobolus stellatus (strain SS14) TaxID=990650 RepID=A0A0C9VAS1_SPHS4|nr:hypothetical protein M422DRAFT_252562 [Sphaerobolus stellatus SS14]
MEFPPFASLGTIQILIIPVGNVNEHSFKKWASLIRSFDTIRLGDIPPDSRDDHARFMPAPLSTGYLHLAYPSHPPPIWHAPLAVFRPSDFPLGIIGITEGSANTSLSSILAQFNAEVAQLFPPNSQFPLAQNCYVFEGEDLDASLNLNESHPGMVVIPNIMGNKELYIGTLIAELCSTILGEFASLLRTLESSAGIETINSYLFPIMSNLSDSQSRPSISLSEEQRSSTPSVIRSSIYGPGRSVPSRAVSMMSPSSKASHRHSGMSVPPTGRLFKILGDLFLLAGRNSDAAVWYGESLTILVKSPQDTVWQASVLEGLCTIQVLDAWNAGQGAQTSITNEGKEMWSDLNDKLTQAIQLYSKGTPWATSSAPEVDSSLIIYLYTQSVCRQTSLLFSIWASKGWGPLAFTTMIHPGLPPAFVPSRPSDTHLTRMSSLTGISRTQIANTVAQAHGPFMLHLEPHDRIRLLQYMATIYSCLGFRRKEVYFLRELLSTVMDVLVCSREEASKNTRDRNSILGVPETANVGLRETESLEGNESIIGLIKYICEVHGIDLTNVKLFDPDADIMQAGSDDETMDGCKTQYGWSDLQVGIVREAVAIVEALPDYATVAQFDLSALKALRTVLNSADQTYLYTNSAKALLTARRRGDGRRVEYWSGNPVVNIQVTPLSTIRLPIQHHARDLFPRETETVISVAIRDPFIYNPRLVASSTKSKIILVQNEPIEFILTLQNQYSFDLEIQSLSLSTSGVPLESQPLTVTIAANSYHVAKITGNALESGILVVRGVVVQMQNGTSREFIVPLATDEEEKNREKRKAIWNTQVDRFKETGLDARPWLRSKRVSIIQEKTLKSPEQLTFMQCNIVAQQPLLRVRRTSLTHGAIMLYDGETSHIRVTVENVSSIPIKFLKVTCIDSTMAPAQQALTDGELSVFEMYETEYELLHRPMFRWDPDNEPKSVPPGRKAVLTIVCSGKIGWQVTLRILYFTRTNPSESLTPSDTFYTRQVIYPILVTVYNTLECYDMDVLSFTTPKAFLQSETHNDYEEWKQVLETLPEGDWCIFTVNVRNTYGIPFEVNFERNQEGTSRNTATRLVAPGSTTRIIMPIKRLLLPESQIAKDIPTLSDRQFVVSKSKISTKEARHRRELFWYREALFKCVKGTWKEAGGVRSGDLSLRQQRFTALMLNALRTDRTSLKLAIVGYDNEAVSPEERNFCRPNHFVYLRAALRNQTPNPLILTMTISTSSAEHVLYDGVITNVPVGRLESGEEQQLEFGVCFISGGRFDLHAEAHVVSNDGDDETLAGKGDLRIRVRSEG